jgi:circadian clock protein KaiB
MGRKSDRDASKIGAAASGTVLVLRLYVSGNTANTRDAMVNINKLCEEHLGEGRYDLEVISISDNPELAKEANINAAPTLIKKFPLPIRRFIGDLSRTEKILVGLDVLTR